MPFCCVCGAPLGNFDNFCTRCGARVQAQQVNTAVPAPQQYQTLPQNNTSSYAYFGTEKVFPFLGRELRVSSGMDTFNYYRKMFKELAGRQTDALAAEYVARINNLDAFLIYFPEMYARYRKPLIDFAMKIILQSGVYDLSPAQFEDQHTADFCLCGQDVDTVIESFNLTIEANQDKKIRMYNMMPGMVFSGLGGFAAALAVNVAVNTIAEADIRNANVNPRQRAEIFARINYSSLMERAFTDYWRVFLSMTWQLNRKGMDVWYPDERANESAAGLYGNLISGMLPQERVPDLLVTLLNLNPYADDPLRYIRQCVGITYETAPIFEYFGFEG